MSSTDVPLGPLKPRCATHPEEDASGTCDRCGTFFCSQCVQLLSGKMWCSACAARPEIYYLEKFRLKLWGRRDGPAWMVGLGSIAFAVFTALSAWQRPRSPWPLTVAFGACVVAGMAFFLRVRRAREALIAVLLAGAALCALFRLQGLAVFMVIFSLVAVSFYFDTRNRLFFQQEVSPERLQRLWHRRENNPRARDALNLGFASLFFPLFAPLAILLGVVALTRVDPHATPPIGRRGQAIAAIVLGTSLLALWGFLLWTSLKLFTPIGG